LNLTDCNFYPAKVAVGSLVERMLLRPFFTEFPTTPMLMNGSSPERRENHSHPDRYSDPGVRCGGREGITLYISRGKMENIPVKATRVLIAIHLLSHFQ